MIQLLLPDGRWIRWGYCNIRCGKEPVWVGWKKGWETFGQAPRSVWIAARTSMEILRGKVKWDPGRVGWRPGARE